MISQQWQTSTGRLPYLVYAELPQVLRNSHGPASRMTVHFHRLWLAKAKHPPALQWWAPYWRLHMVLPSNTCGFGHRHGSRMAAHDNHSYEGISAIEESSKSTRGTSINERILEEGGDWTTLTPIFRRASHEGRIQRLLRLSLLEDISCQC